MKVSETGIPGVWLRHYPTGRSRYGFTVVWNGKAERRVSKVNTKRGAAAERQKAVERLAAGLPLDPKPDAPPFTVAEAVKDYEEASVGLRSYENAQLYTRRFTEILGTLPVEALSQVNVAGFRKRLLDEKISVATTNRHLSFLRAALNHAKGRGKVERDHYFLKLSKADRKKVFQEEAPSAGIRRVSNEQFEAVLAGLPEPFRSPARLLLATAARKEEILHLRWGNVRGDSLYFRHTKSGKPRSVPLSPEAQKLLPVRPEGAGDEDLVFRGRDGGSLSNNFNRAWNKSRKDAGLEWLRVHDLRHEAASRFIEAGGTLRELQVLGGWSSLELVERYAKVEQERIREALSRVKLPALNPASEYTVSTPIAFEKKAALAK
jgi:integrase